MVAALGFATILTFLALTMFVRRVSVPVALILVPVVFAVAGGWAGDMGEMIGDGLLKVAPVAIMIAFAVLYFSLMVDVGLFDPVIRRVLRWAGGSPTKVAVGTAVITLLVALDGDGTSTFLITVTALLPIYRRIGMRPVVMTGIIALAAGMMNIIPWGGPTARAMAALDMTSGDLFIPLLVPMAAGAVWVIAVAWFLGRREARRIGTLSLDEPAGGRGPEAVGGVVTDASPTIRVRPVVRVFNVVLTLVLLVILLLQLVPLEVAFAVAFALALIVNLPHWSDQQELMQRHGGNVVMVVMMVLAAGVLTGILTGTGMITAIAETLVSWVPDSAAGALPVITALTSMPLSMVMTADAYYFGVVPVLAETAASFGGDPAEIGRAALLGNGTTGFPVSPLAAATFILLGLSNVELQRHQRYIFGWAFGTTVVMTVAALATGAISV
ncbi:CitMHS family transporter [Pseudonocardia pini]|uniref:CitMHS family transporter n=1 Tax=Pseudonocardia pini TaxID=2758030 RepID=UPI0015F117DB|nr:citrate:proton symporter [Pseudonocardia pini]